MRQLNRIWAALALVCALVFAAGPGMTATAQDQENARASGQVSDIQGTPFPGIIVTFRNTTTGQIFEVTTDAAGRYSRGGLPPGNYSISLKHRDEVVYQIVAVLTPGQDAIFDFNFKELQAQADAEAAEAERQRAEAQAKFAAMKQHFDAGIAALDQAKAIRAEMDKLPANQQSSRQGELDQVVGTAISELQMALEGTEEGAPNRGLVLARLGDAYETIRKYPEAADAYAKAVAIRPDAGSYNNLGNALARTGKVDEALKAYEQAIQADPTNTALYWRNFAVGLYNTGRIAESLEPLQKAVQADPNSAQAWYLLGAALVYTMEFQQDGDKMVPVMKPGTVEAYQKAIELDPNGPYGAQARQGLEALQAMGVGIDTRVQQQQNQRNRR